MIEIHGLKACDTCRKALKALNDAKVESSLRDLRATPPSRPEIERWHAVFGDSLLNIRSTTWRGLSAEERGGEPIDLMVAYPALIKRPVVLDGNQLYLGWTPATRSAIGL
ncbi:MAG: ArsC/Spx/MgsR family protein [Jannaschia sp.]